MTWRDQIQRGSFRGVPFLHHAAHTDGGRRLAVHEYPGRDEPYAEDLGERARRFEMELFVAGADYLAEADALEDVLRKSGPGTLVHPYKGTLSVFVERYRRSETTREGGKASFAVTFVQAGANRQPGASADTRAKAGIAADGVLSAARDAFADDFTTDDLSEFVRASGSDLVGQVIDRVEALADNFTGADTAFAAAIATARANLSTLVTDPSGLGDTITDLVGRFGRLGSGTLGAVTGLRTLFGFGDDLPAVSTATPTRRIEGDNQAAVVSLVKQAAVAEAVRAAAAVEAITPTTPAATSAGFAGRDDALTERTRLADLIDQAADTADDAAFAALADLKRAMVADLTTRAAGLPGVVNHTPTATIPALVIAHELYGDPTRDMEIAARNRVRHPGFVTGGHPLEVLAA